MVPGVNYNSEMKNETKLFCWKFSGIAIVSIYRSNFVLKWNKIKFISFLTVDNYLKELRLLDNTLGDK